VYQHLNLCFIDVILVNFRFSNLSIPWISGSVKDVGIIGFRIYPWHPVLGNLPQSKRLTCSPEQFTRELFFFLFPFLSCAVVLLLLSPRTSFFLSCLLDAFFRPADDIVAFVIVGSVPFFFIFLDFLAVVVVLGFCALVRPNIQNQTHILPISRPLSPKRTPTPSNWYTKKTESPWALGINISIFLWVLFKYF